MDFVSEEDAQDHRELVQDAITILQAVLDGKEIDIDTCENCNERASYSIDRKHKRLGCDEAKQLEAVIETLGLENSPIGLIKANTPTLDDMKAFVKKRIEDDTKQHQRAIKSWRDVLAELESEQG